MGGIKMSKVNINKIYRDAFGTAKTEDIISPVSDWGIKCPPRSAFDKLNRGKVLNNMCAPSKEKFILFYCANMFLEDFERSEIK
jgi:hypothetical protein